MENIIYVQPIFCPNENAFNRTVNSINSMIAYLQKYPRQLNVVIGGYVKNDSDYWEKLVSVSKPLNPTMKRFDRNYGKGYVMRELFNLALNFDFEYILTADSDIIFRTEEKNMFERLEELAIKSPEFTKRLFGMTSIKFLECDTHLSNVYENRYEYVNQFGDKEVVVYPNGEHGIGGGVIFTSKAVWQSVGGYKVWVVYGWDDAGYLHDLRVKGLSIQVLTSMSVIHPHDIDKEYLAWKGRTCGPQGQSLEYYVKEAEKFWRTRK